MSEPTPAVADDTGSRRRSDGTLSPLESALIAAHRANHEETRGTMRDGHGAIVRALRRQEYQVYALLLLVAFGLALVASGAGIDPRIAAEAVRVVVPLVAGAVEPEVAGAPPVAP